MTYSYQRDSFVKHLQTCVVSCKPCVKRASNLSHNYLKISNDVSIHGFEVVLKDTIFYPEGGGQSADSGHIDDHLVMDVQQDESTEKISHFVVVEDLFASAEMNLQPLFVENQMVTLKIDWERRFDHMQQHSAQHLISAVCESKFEWKTVSWWLASTDLNRSSVDLEISKQKVGESYIELEMKGKCDLLEVEKSLREVESVCNDFIRKSVNVNIKLYKTEEERKQLVNDNVTTDGQLAKMSNSSHVRVIEIKDDMTTIDKNLCCGTHVTSLSQIQMVKVVSVTKSKKSPNRVYLYFLAGDRVSKYVEVSKCRSKMLTNVLVGGVEDHVMLAEKAVHNSKLLTKQMTSLLRELVEFEAAKYCQQRASGEIKFIFHHRREGGLDYARQMVQLIKDKDDFKCICVVMGDERVAKPSCSLLLYSPSPDTTSDLLNKILSVFEGKGGGSGKQVTAKISGVKNVSKLESVVENFFN